VLEAIVTACRRRKGDRNAPLKALLVDSWYDAYLGVVVSGPRHRRRAEEGQRSR
jgi:translation elongation factor EF-4